MVRLSAILSFLLVLAVALPFRPYLQGLVVGDALKPAAFKAKYGPWGIVVGASRGLGSAWAHALAKVRVRRVMCGRRRVAAWSSPRHRHNAARA
jgi:hypothetical protein